MKIVSFDLETLPDLREVMKVYAGLSAYPGLTLKATHTTIICFGYKILGEKRAHVQCAWDYPSWDKNVNDDKELCRFAYEMLHDADVVITHNGRKFDMKHLQTRLLKNGLPTLPTSIIHIDTRQIASKNLFSVNNKLDTLGSHFVGERKMENGGWGLWCDVLDRDPKAQETMRKYCKQDVLLLEKLYLKLRPLIKSLPNPNSCFKGNLHCPNCSSQMLQKRGTMISKSGLRQRYLCQDCGSWSSEKISSEKVTLKPF